MRALTILTATGCGVVGGVFFAFSTFVMRGLRGAPPEAGLRAMQGINRAAPSPPFLLALLGTAGCCVVLGSWSLADLDGDGARWRVTGCAAYLVVVVATAAYHVPRNEVLALVDPASTGAGDSWVRYAREWTAGNHARSVAGIAAATLLTMSL